ncbi:aspartyl/asparaginyl beta-hydroxylase domain-containing protein [Streptomyces sp. NPDC096176]|uniref:aspartyl/asparaginyl beta-hydroxylase domain-containing protein n=1 Tax=Streptomyces sp. NPDC096176 TaxID=3366079 RepID=UPI00382923C8
MLATDAMNSVLQNQVARVRPVDSLVLDRLRHEALTVPDEWVAEYGQFQSGGWWTVSLLNDSGVPTDVEIKDCDPVETSLLQRMPAMRKFLSELGLRYMWVRLARLEPNSFLWEHRDYTELDESEHQRLHVPLVTNSSSALVTGGARVHMREGHLWRLNPTHVHGACNMLGPDRIHLVIDCYADDVLADMRSGEALTDDDVTCLHPVTREQLDQYVDVARTLMKLGYDQQAESYLLRLFYQHALPEGEIYDLIASLHEPFGRVEHAATWLANKSVLLGRA